MANRQAHERGVDPRAGTYISTSMYYGAPGAECSRFIGHPRSGDEAGDRGPKEGRWISACGSRLSDRRGDGGHGTGRSQCVGVRRGAGGTRRARPRSGGVGGPDDHVAGRHAVAFDGDVTRAGRPNGSLRTRRCPGRAGRCRRDHRDQRRCPHRPRPLVGRGVGGSVRRHPHGHGPHCPGGHPASGGRRRRDGRHHSRALHSHIPPGPCALRHHEERPGGVHEVDSRGVRPSRGSGPTASVREPSRPAAWPR